VAQSAAAAGAGGINDDNKERVVKGSVGEPSKAQPTVDAGVMHIRHRPGQVYMLSMGECHASRHALRLRTCRQAALLGLLAAAAAAAAAAATSPQIRMPRA
jgi:hypothetical protein